MKRRMSSKLLEWKEDKDRKPLLLRGARQVGKTYLIRELGKTFPYVLEVNFEMDRRAHRFFADSLDPQPIVEKLSLLYNTPVVPGETLLFLDEVQACPDALRSLRFFYEKMPALHVAAAGSLLELAIAKIPSFGVGRIASLFLYPMSFFEYLDALGESRLARHISEGRPDRPLDPAIHDKTLERIRVYQMIGGLPEAVRYYAERRDLLGCQEIIDHLITTLSDDFAKFESRVPVEKLTEVFRAAAQQGGGKFVYSRISADRSAHYRTALDLLVKAGLVYKVHHTSARGLPLGAQINDRRFKAALFDTGIYQRLSGLDLAERVTLNHDELINRGAMAELSVCAALAVAGPEHRRPELYYWHREQRGANAEVDYVTAWDGRIVPVEVKSGSRGAMQSLFLFLEERGLDLGVRVSAENFGRYGKLAVVPIYAAENLPAILNDLR